MKLTIRHNTNYSYEQPLLHAIQELRLTPQNSAHQTVDRWGVKGLGPLVTAIDAWGNRLHTATLNASSAYAVIQRNQVIAEGVVQTSGEPYLTPTPEDPLPQLYLRPTWLTEPHPRLTDFARPFKPSAAGTWEVTAIVDLAAAVADKVQYRAGQTNVDTTALEAFDWGRGVCQDQAHVMVTACRSLGVPTRYVSGYFYAPDAPELASHAWVDVWHKGGWISVDVTHARLMDERYVRLATGPDYAACAPIKGVRSGGGKENMDVKVSMAEIEVP
jgi:transglutaminase-like putative cysteine protease